MSGGLFTDQLLREIDRDLGPDAAERLRALHAAAYQRLSGTVAVGLLRTLSGLGISWAIATSGRMETAAVNIAALDVDPAEAVVVTRDQVRFAKPDPDLFEEAARRLDVGIEDAIVVGDSIRDMLAAAGCHALGVGLLSGGYGREELERSRALCVYEDPAERLRSGLAIAGEKAVDDGARQPRGPLGLGIDAAPARRDFGQHLLATAYDGLIERACALHLFEQDGGDDLVVQKRRLAISDFVLQRDP